MPPLILYAVALLAWPARCVRLQTAPGELQTVVAGTQHLDPLEMDGKMPILVDAFLNEQGTGAYVVLNFSPLYGPNTRAGDFAHWTGAGGAAWKCTFAPPVEARGSSLMRETDEVHNAEVEASVLFSSLHGASVDDSLAVRLGRSRTDDEEQEEADSDGDGSPPQAPSTPDSKASDMAAMFRYRHHALVLGCPLPQHMDRLPGWLLSVVGSNGGEELYKRNRIRVNRGSFVRSGSQAVLCTMVNKPTELLRPWAKFHASLGFDQILIYAEMSNISAMQKPLGDLVDQGTVTIVPFFFGAVSESANFYMQAGMEQHCLYQAKGRAAWLGHSDEDEFLDFRSAPKGGIAGYLQGLKEGKERAVAVTVRSQEWRIAANTTAGSIPFPCYFTCKKPSYHPVNKRSKWIARPEMVTISNPHIVDADGPIHVADPETELRLNHFRHVWPAMACSENKGCSEDLAFRDSCSAMVQA